MTLALVVSLVLSQVIYEWTDSQGETHFTDDPTTIPKGVKARTTQGAELSVVPSTGAPAAPVDAGTPRAASSGTPSCGQLKHEVAALEQKVAALKAAPAEAAAKAAEKCQALLHTHGRGEYARCMAQRESSATDPRLSAQLRAAEEQLVQKREELRRAQVSGCRP